MAGGARERRVAKNTGLRLRRPLGAYHDGGALLRLRHLALQRLQLRHQVGDAGGLARALGKLLLHLSAAARRASGAAHAPRRPRKRDRTRRAALPTRSGAPHGRPSPLAPARRREIFSVQLAFAFAASMSDSVTAASVRVT